MTVHQIGGVNVPTKRNANIQVYRILTMCG
nr:MAG TPA: hypothetical protein [Bacteriophage sp.]DAL67104.1 MAG TPA: hypothetical protein [Bacteriophage sp.]DAR34621.1 MAG TPA: hypothetical protein [Caudoviricetes sp.]